MFTGMDGNAAGSYVQYQLSRESRERRQHEQHAGNGCDTVPAQNRRGTADSESAYDLRHLVGNILVQS